MSEVRAPWTEEKVTALCRWQLRDDVHPFTCTCGARLVPTVDGWRCAYCPDYRQGWCHDFMLDSPDK